MYCSTLGANGDSPGLMLHDSTPVLVIAVAPWLASISYTMLSRWMKLAIGLASVDVPVFETQPAMEQDLPIVYNEKLGGVSRGPVARHCRQDCATWCSLLGH